MARAETKPNNRMKMTNIGKRYLAFALALLLVDCGCTLSAAPKTEEQLVKDLGSSSVEKITSALQQLEMEHPNSPASLPAIKGCLSNSHTEVRRKAARVLGAVHADVDAESVKLIVALLKSSEPRDVIDGLKSLRGIRGYKTVADILPLLHHSHLNVIRDACRTLAALGNKTNIPAIEPLLKHADKEVRKDAQDAITILSAKR